MADISIKPGLPSFYSKEQLDAYLQKIGFKAPPGPFTPDLASLEVIVRLHLITFPFEMTPFHYSPDHMMDTSPEYVYDRLVQKQLGGTWCCGTNGLLLGMLRAFGYRAMAVSARVNSPPADPPAFEYLTHLLLLVQLEDGSDVATNHENSIQTYLVDVGFGGTGLACPILLKAGHTVPGPAPPAEHRVSRTMHPNSSLVEADRSQEWALEYRCGSHQPNWEILYIFCVVETYPQDWVIYAEWLSTHPVKLFTDSVVCNRYFFLDPSDTKTSLRDKHIGTLVMKDKRVQRRIGDTSTTVKEFTTERERVKILREDFGIIVDENDIINIRAPAALP